MNILRLSTLSLAIALAVITLSYANYSSAEKPGACPDHPSCGGGGGSGGDAAAYEAALTMGGFIFSPKPVTLKGQGDAYKGDAMLTMMRSDGVTTDDRMAWDTVLSNCEPLLMANASFDVKSGKWKISSGGIRLRFSDIDFGIQGVDIDIDLNGEVGIDPIVPVCGPPSVFTLTTYSISGQAKRGLPGPSCNTQGVLYPESVLEIERIDCP
jgi:hypothetical protein